MVCFSSWTVGGCRSVRGKQDLAHLRFAHDRTGIERRNPDRPGVAAAAECPEQARAHSRHGQNKHKGERPVLAQCTGSSLSVHQSPISRQDVWVSASIP